MNNQRENDLFENYYDKLYRAVKDMETTLFNQERISRSSAIEKTVQYLIEARARENKLMFIGNGASASISSHQAADYLKNIRINAVAFNDPVQLTAISNDSGYGYVFQIPIERSAKKGDILFAISSSGKSENIINAVKTARDKDVTVITFSGFSNDNPLRKLGDVNFYVPSQSYGIVEVTHHSLCHSILDYMIEKNYKFKV